MDSHLKPSRFDGDHTATTGSSEWTHWKRTFSNFINAVKKKTPEGETVNSLDILINYVSPKIFTFIADCTTYELAIQTLDSLFIKEVNQIFARHKLATRKQQPSEDLDQFMQALKTLSKECKFTSVSADVYAQEAVRDAFISGMASHQIRTRLLENNTLTLDNAFSQARALESAHKHSQTYDMINQPVGMTASLDKNNATSEGELSVESEASNQVAATSQYRNNNTKKCQWCGRYPSHPKSRCFAKNSTCRKCGLKGHWDSCCRSSTVSSIQAAPSDTMPSLYAIGNFNSKVILTASVNRIPAKALCDTGATLTCMSENFAQKNDLKIVMCNQRVQLAAKFYVTITGYVTVNLKIKGHVYRSLKLAVLPDMVQDVIVGTDLMEQHQAVTVNFGGSRPPLMLNALGEMRVTAPSLFANLTKDVHPIAAKSRRYSLADKRFIQEEVDKLLKSGIIEPSNSPWRAQLLVERSPNHRDRLVVDYSETINKFTLLDAYPLPLMEDVASELAKFEVMSGFDLKSAFHQVKLPEKDKIFTAFQAGQNLYQFTRVPFGLRNSSACFQRIMDELIKDNKLKGVVTYIDNVYVGGDTQEEHDANVQKLLEVAANVNITFNQSKSISSVTEISLLGYLISKGIKKPDPERVKDLLNLPAPKNMDEQKRVLGLFAYYSQWIGKFSEIIYPLNKNTQFPISEEANDAFIKLKNILSKATLMPILEGVPFTVETDASKFAIGATLNQKGKPVAFYSRTLHGSEMHHSAVEKEAYSIVEALRKWYYLLIGNEFTLITDQRSVAFMFDAHHKSKIKNEKILRWRIELSALSYNVVYRPGTENAAADTLSRTCSIVKIDSLKNIHEGLCHPGITRLNHYVRTKNLPYSTNDVKNVVLSCKTCCEIKPKFYKPPASNLIKAMQPFDRLSVDFKGPLPSRTKNKYLLNIVDEYSRFVFAFPCSDMTAATVIKSLTVLFTIFGMPNFIHSDKGSSLLSSELRTFLHSNGIATSNTTPYHPTGNGQCERYNGVIWTSVLLALKTKGLPTECWEEVLPEVLHANRSLLCTATNSTPHERLFKFPRKTSLGNSLPSWLLNPGTVLLKNYYRTSKYEPIVNEVELIDANPHFAKIRYQDGSEANVSIKDLAPAGGGDSLKTTFESLITNSQSNVPSEFNFNPEIPNDSEIDKTSNKLDFKNDNVIPQATLPESGSAEENEFSSTSQSNINGSNILVNPQTETCIRRSDRTRRAPDRLQM